MNDVFVVIAATSILVLSAAGIAGANEPAPSHKQMMKTCMDKQKAENSKMPTADMKKFCTASVKEQKVSSGPETGTLERPHQ